MGALIVIDVHAREVVGTLVKVRVDSVNDFDWTCRLRYYWEPEEEEQDVFARQTNTRFRYGYEYLGNGPRLVITPLTDKRYMTLTAALHLYFARRPQGPAGTGKTETTKDLAKAPFNGGLESAARLPDGRLMLLAEQLRDGNGDFVGWVGRPGAWQAFAYAATGPYEPAGAATGPDGRVYLLERRFNPLGGFGVRVTRFPAADLAPGARIEAEELAVFEPPYVQENFEAIAALADPAGGVRLYIASDDNFSFLQRTLLLAFRVAE